MERKAYLKLLQWKNHEDRKPLVVKGARQVGKTWLVSEFGKREYKSFVYINCDSNEKISELFDHDFDITRILRGLSAVSNVEIKPNETLVFLDEIQEIPRTVQSLKYFCEDAPDYHIIAAGSLLGIYEHKDISFPVGKIESLELYPLSFSEFVLAAKGEQMYRMLMDSHLNDLNALHSTFVELLRQYYFTGGMPAPVQAFVEGKSIVEVREIQKQILSDYSNDISKHVSPSQLVRIDQVWNSIPSQLAKENRKFVYANIQKGARAKEFETAIQWLCNSGTVRKVNRCSKGRIPLKFYEDFSAFKLYLLDCGLLGALTEVPASEILIGNNVFEEYKGSFSESFVMQQMLTVLKTSLFYFSADDSKQEIDFMFQKGEKVIPVEVKAEENLRAKSLRQFCLDNEGTVGVRFSMSPYREQDWMVNIPLYAVERIFDESSLHIL
jgi:predicted AAA+ superfamily ATPase